MLVTKIWVLKWCFIVPLHRIWTLVKWSLVFHTFQFSVIIFSFPSMDYHEEQTLITMLIYNALSCNVLHSLCGQFLELKCDLKTSCISMDHRYRYDIHLHRPKMVVPSKTEIPNVQAQNHDGSISKHGCLCQRSLYIQVLLQQSPATHSVQLFYFNRKARRMQLLIQIKKYDCYNGGPKWINSINLIISCYYNYNLQKYISFCANMNWWWYYCKRQSCKVIWLPACYAKEWIDH